MNDLPYGSTTLFCPVLRGRHQSPSVVPASRPITEITEINQDLARIRNWCFDNLNPDKTKLLLCGSKQMAAKIDNFQLSLLGKPQVAQARNTVSIGEHRRASASIGIVASHLKYKDFSSMGKKPIVSVTN